MFSAHDLFRATCLVALVAAAVLLSACGGGSDEPTEPMTAQLIQPARSTAQ